MAGGGDDGVAMNGSNCGEIRLEARHRPSGENSRFMGEGLAFGEYVPVTARIFLQGVRPIWYGSRMRGKPIGKKEPRSVDLAPAQCAARH